MEIAFYDDGSEYAWRLRSEISDSDFRLVGFTMSDELSGALGLDTFAVLLVNPHRRLARACSRVVRGGSGEISRIPLIFAVSKDSAKSADFLYCDDFIVEPAALEEILLRVRVLKEKRIGTKSVIKRGDLLVNTYSHRVILSGKPLDFTYKEFELLKTLASNPGRVFTREELLCLIWGSDYYGGTRTVDVHIRRIRSKIEVSRRYIETVHGVGYCFSPVFE